MIRRAGNCSGLTRKRFRGAGGIGFSGRGGRSGKYEYIKRTLRGASLYPHGPFEGSSIDTLNALLFRGNCANVKHPLDVRHAFSTKRTRLMAEAVLEKLIAST